MKAIVQAAGEYSDSRRLIGRGLSRHLSVQRFSLLRVVITVPVRMRSKVMTLLYRAALGLSSYVFSNLLPMGLACVPVLLQCCTAAVIQVVQISCGTFTVSLDVCTGK